MMFTTLIGAMTLALGPCNATCSKGISTPRVIEIRAAMFDPTEVNRNQIRFSDETVGEVVAEVSREGAVEWAGSDRERLGGQNAPELIYVQIFDGVFAIDPFSPLPEATDATARQLFRGTSLETDRTQHGRKHIDRTKELFAKLERARLDWLRANGFAGVRRITNPHPRTEEGEQARGKSLPEPSAVFQRPPDVPRGKSHEEVRVDDQPSMGALVAMLRQTDEPVRVSLPEHMRTTTVARVERRDHGQDEVVSSEADADTEEVAVNR